ncbi:MAG: type II toxin-antitoxin system VapC family toxin [Thermoleophilia bacterium]
MTGKKLMAVQTPALSKPAAAKKPPSTIVIDTSVAAKWFLPEPLSDEADAVLEQARLGRLLLSSPDLISYEFANILWKRQKKGELSSSQAMEIMFDFERLPIELVPAEVLGAEALKIACSTGCTAYDGAFVALAAGLKCRLLTADRKLVQMMSETRFARRVRWLGK